MASPAERYAAARRRRATPRLTAFAAGLPFSLDPFQEAGCTAVEEGHSVLVAAPTGAGKTVVGEFAVHLALATGRRCFYTTPIKALSNQKYADLTARYGAATTGLLTGDTAVNGSAQVVVMTTEVLRNMIYASSPALDNLGHVVLDEVHYLADRERGAVWEEVIINLPEQVALVALSATVSNAEEFGDWLRTVRGDTAVIVDEHRPVPLWQSMFVGRRRYDLFADEAQQVLDPHLLQAIRRERRTADITERYGRGRRPAAAPRWRPPSGPDLLARLDGEGLLPAIVFVFSRAGCDAAVEQCARTRLRLTTPEERAAIRGFAEEHTAALADEDLAVLGYPAWLDSLERGVAAHHAGALPVFKETVERLFTAGLLKAVFATETLALGINMPARSVVLERLTKWNGETHAPVTPGEFTQLTGRAGRRGIDVEGHAITVWTPEIDPADVAGLASARTYPLRSSFRPSYNMAVNLAGTVGRRHARRLLESSFAQFQADRSVLGLTRQLAERRQRLTRQTAQLRCERGDPAGYAALRRSLTDREREAARSTAAQRRAATAATLEGLRVGDLVRLPAGRRTGLAAVVGTAPPTVVTADRRLLRLSAAELGGPVEPLGTVRVPRNFNARSPASRRDLAATIRDAVPAHLRRPPRQAVAADDAELGRLRAAIRGHGVHGCPEREQHVRDAEALRRLRAEVDALAGRVAERTHVIARTFDRVCELLEELGYLAGDAVTPAGRLLARLYGEADLLVAECLRRGVWRGLDPPGLAAMVSSLVFEARRPEDAAPPVPRGPARTALADTAEVHAELVDAERRHRLALVRGPDPGFAAAAARWAQGRPLQDVLLAGDLPAGDFVRWCRQTIDLLDQIRSAGEAGAGDVGRTAATAVAALRRGVVALGPGA
jgi:ATP-dependent RNA helicase HelY